MIDCGREKRRVEANWCFYLSSPIKSAFTCTSGTDVRDIFRIYLTLSPDSLFAHKILMNKC